MSKNLKLTLRLSKEQIAKRVYELAKEIEKDYKDEDVVAVGVLNGAAIFFTDLVRNIDNTNLSLDFIRVSTYGQGTESSHTLAFKKDIELDIKGKHLILVEDIIDSGFTMSKLIEIYKNRGASSIAICALINKTERREVDVKIDYAGFEMADGFIVGYGLDYAEKYRQLPAIYEVEIE